MMWPGGGFGSGWMIIWGLMSILIWALIILGIVAIITWLVRQPKGGQPSETALDILQKRYASGELSKEQYEEMKKELS